MFTPQSRAFRLGQSLSIFMVILLVGCVPGRDPVQPLAMRRTGDGEIEVLYVPCEPGVVKGFDITGSEPKVPGKSRRIGVPLWEIAFDESSPPDAFVLGELPEGATEVRPWRGELLDDEWSYSAEFDWEGGSPGWARHDARFELGDLEPGIVLYGEETMTEAEFREMDLCEDDRGPDEPPVYPEL